MSALDRPHLPEQAPIDSYGNGGFRFAGMSHRGSLLCLPSGLWSWDAETPTDIVLATLAPVFEGADPIDILVIGTGAAMATIPPETLAAAQARGIGLEVGTTGAAVRIYNIVLAERRRVAAALIAVP